MGLLAAGIRGERRRDALRARVVRLLQKQVAHNRHAVPGRSDAEAKEFLGQLLRAPVWEDEVLIAGVTELALTVASPDLLARLGDWLGGGQGAELRALAAAEVGHPLLAVLDIETRPGSSWHIDEVSVAIVRRDRVLRRLDLVASSGSPIDAEVVTAWLAGQIVVAHNGENHDFPILETCGVAVPEQRLDTLFWAWLAFPAAASHSLASLRELLGIDVAGETHTAAVDVDLLRTMLPRIVSAIQAFPATTRHRLAGMLVGHVADGVLDLVLGGDPSDEPVPAAGTAATGDDWRLTEPATSGQASDRRVEQHPDLAAWSPSDPEQLVVVDDLRAAPAVSGRWASGGQLIDPSFPGDAAQPGGWVQAVALRVLETGYGHVGFWPPSAAALLDGVPRRPSGTYVAGQGPWVADLASVADRRPDRPTVLLDAVELLFGGAGFDPAELDVPVTAVVSHAGPRRPEMTAFWEAALGGPVSITGSSAPVSAQVTVLEGIPRTAGVEVATARSLAVAAGRATESPTVYVTSGERAELAVAAVRTGVRHRLGTPLLNPPAWPTVTEAVQRLRRRAHLAVTTFGPAPRLAAAGAELVLDRLGTPSSDIPIVGRLLAGSEDAYGHVVEPVTALRLLRLLGRASAPVWICDPVADNPLFRAALTATTPTRQPITRNEDTDIGRWVTGAVLTAAGGIKSVGDDGERGDPRAYLSGEVRRLLGHGAELKPPQKTVIGSLLDGHDVLAVFRTGLGKSLCYQAPALALGAAGHGCTVVISPLLALQRDQVATLRSRRIWEATAVNSELAADVRAARLRGIRAGFYRLIYVAPEGLQSAGIRDALREGGVALLAVDEAHCISEMGHDFRPDYRTIPAAVRGILGLGDNVALTDLDDRPRMIALTGTARPQTRDDIVELLEGRFRRHVDTEFVRKELSFDVIRVEEEVARSGGGDPVNDRPQRWQLLVDTLQGALTPAIVYALTKKDVEQLAEGLTSALGYEVAAYHGGLEHGERRRVERAFLDGECQVVVATNAFGMGVDKPDIRMVLHWRMPGSPEALYQEAGRAGRDEEGQPARCIVLYHPSDLRQSALIAEAGVPDKGELTRAWSTLEELHQLQGAKGSVVVGDADLKRLAGLRADVEASVVLARLADSGLIREGGRQPAVVPVTATGEPLPADLPETERLIAQLVMSDGAPVGQLGSRGTLPVSQQAVTLELAQVADRLGLKGLTSTLSEIRSAIRHLESVGVLRMEPPRVGARALAANPGSKVEFGWRDVRRVAREIPEWGWATVETKKVELSVDRILIIVELLSVLGCIRVQRHLRSGRSPAFQKAQRPLSELTRLAEISPAIVAEAATSTGQLVDLQTLARNHGASVDEVREALLVGHILQAVMLDPRSWEQRHSASPCRQITVNETADDAETLIDQVVTASRQRNHEAGLRRRALDAYADLLSPPDDDGLIYQRFLERYFTEPTFLADIEAASAQDFLDGLDSEQQAAVRSDARQLVVRAGAGTGKTRTLTRRIAYNLVTGLLPSDALAVCFNKQAAVEMTERLAALGMPSVRVRTLNAVGAQVIREYWPKLDFLQHPELVQQGEQAQVIEALAQSTEHSRQGGRLQSKQVQSAIQLAKLRLQVPGQARGNQQVDTAFLNSVYAKYEDWLAANNRIDFQDQILRAIPLLDDPDVAVNVCHPLRAVFVDEAQDLSPAEWALVRALSHHASLTVVGDPRQAINEWKGASPELFDLMSAEPGTATVDLVRNYRSRPQLLDMPNQLMAQYPPLVAVDAQTGEATAKNLPDTTKHDAYIAGVVTNWLNQGIADDDIAVLCRNNSQVSRVAKRLAGDNIRTRSLGLPPLHNTVAFRMAERYLADIYDPDLYDLATAMKEVAAMSVVEDAILAGASATPGAGDEDPWSEWHHLTAELADQEGNGSIGATKALENVAAESRKENRAPGGVTVTTIHRSKGLEWQAVVIAEATKKSLRDEPEARRLAYVALTRAQSRRRVVSHDADEGRSRVFDRK